MSTTWKLCSACRNPITYGSVYQLCSVSTCNRKRTARYFCSVECWDAHLPGARHRDAWAEENVAPASEEAEKAAKAKKKAAKKKKT